MTAPRRLQAEKLTEPSLGEALVLPIGPELAFDRSRFHLWFGRSHHSALGSGFGLGGLLCGQQVGGITFGRYPEEAFAGARASPPRLVISLPERQSLLRGGHGLVSAFAKLPAHVLL
eukprot:scaffold22684_cov63-Phaeocystis_antarctica.AAC.3